MQIRQRSLEASTRVPSRTEDYTEPFALNDARCRESPRFGAAGVFAGRGRPAVWLDPKGPDRRAADWPCRVRHRAGSSHVAAPVLPGGAGSRRPRSWPARLIPRQHQHARPFPGSDPADVFCRGVDRSATPALRAGSGRLRSRQRNGDPRAGAGHPPHAPHPRLRGRRARPRDSRVDARAARLSPLHAARRCLVLAIDRRRDGRGADMGGVVVWSGGTPRLSVPDLPVVLAPTRVGSVPVASLPHTPAARANAPGSCGGTRIPRGCAGALRDHVHRSSQR